LYVSGCYLKVAMTDVQVVPVNRSVLFMEEKDVIVSSDVWRIAVNLDTKT
jgi:hypothetical protein